ncbi:MAG: hypothetical protein ACRDPE_23465 [Solirubrobacterales bacterium]
MWEILPYSAGDKSIMLKGPSDGFYPQILYVDFDDVYHPEVERRLPLMVEALNSLGLVPPTPAQMEDDMDEPE